jgi:1-hydroxycarotenoid 3,4-desaturase
MATPRIAIIGAGMAGLSAALDLVMGGARVTVIERARTVGGKMREIEVGAARIDGGPTVFTMRAVFEELFAAAGARLEEYVPLERAEIIARHAWSEGQTLDLYADSQRTTEAIGAFAGPHEARRYAQFVADAQRVFRTLEYPFIRAPRAGPLTLLRRVGLRKLPDLVGIRPFESLWSALSGYFRDQRLRQLFGRYSTYTGSSPFQAPATLMLIAHVEKEGVWVARNGMHALATSLAQIAMDRGAQFRLATEAASVVVNGDRACGVRLASGEFVPGDAVIVNADTAAISSGRLGDDVAAAVPGMAHARRSLSAVTWALLAQARGFPLVRHCVFFSPDYALEFDQILKRRELPSWPTVYVCAQDRPARDSAAPAGAERLLCLVNAPPTGDVDGNHAAELEQCERRTFTFLERCGLTLDRQATCTVTTTPSDFEHLFPGTGGALYGQATHGWRASFTRPGARTRIPGLYVAGGSVHPGPGLPMAALSGRQAAASVLGDLASNSRWRSRVTAGGTSTR